MRLLLGVFGLAAAGSILLASPAQGQKKSRDLITREEILNSPQSSSDLYSVIRSLRPHFLLPPRGVRSMGGGGRMSAPVFYLNGNRMGELAGLRQILAQDVFEVKYLDPSKAEDEFGVGANGGAVLVTLVKGIKSEGRIVPPA